MPPSSTLPDYSTAPSLEDRQVYSPRARKEAGVSSSYVDQYNDSQLAQYNNEYNYWLWQQQAEYNSPANQMARAREAGLNPNVVAGNVSSGNLSSTPESKANYKSHIFENKMQAVNTGINAFNSVINAVKDGVQSVSQLSGIPMDIANYRRLLNSSQIGGVNLTMANEIAKNLENLRSGYLMFGNSFQDMFKMLGFPNVADAVRGSDRQFIAPIITKALEDSYYGQGLMNSLVRQGLTNQSISEDVNLKGWKNRLYPSIANELMNKIALQELQMEYMGLQNEFYKTGKIVPWILGGAGTIAKLF